MRKIKIISGGQTGADRAALDFAIERGFDYGGFIPKGRRSEDGTIDERYEGLSETGSKDYEVRTAENVRTADLTIILTRGVLADGSLLTFQSARRGNKPVLHFNLSATAVGDAALQTAEMINETHSRVLNIAGPRASDDPLIYELTKEFLRKLTEHVDE